MGQEEEAKQRKKDAGKKASGEKKAKGEGKKGGKKGKKSKDPTVSCCSAAALISGMGWCVLHAQKHCVS